MRLGQLPGALARPPGGSHNKHTHAAPACALAPASLQVRSSTAASKRSFLERKGLTQEEIDEAFRRVPETAAPAASPAPTAPASAGVPGVLQTTVQHLQPAAYPQQPGALVVQPGGAPPQPQPLRWSQVGGLRLDCLLVV